jgi:hypothetical protein
MSETDESTGHAFISYVHENSRKVDELQRTLEAAGIDVWRDTDDLWPGEDWRARIRDAITHSAMVFIVCFSKEGVARKKSYQNEELALAIEEMRNHPPEISWLIPVRLDDCEIPDRDIGGGRTLSSIHRADLFGSNAMSNAERLVAVVLRILKQTAGPPGTTESSAQSIPGGNATGAPPPAPPQSTLPSLVGMWRVEIQSGYTAMIQMVRFVSFPDGQTQYEGFFPSNPAVRDTGEWRLAGSQLMLAGTRTVAGPFPQQQQFELTISFSSWDYMNLVGINSIGESVTFRRQA